jgi:hypothetical protein
MGKFSIMVVFLITGFLLVLLKSYIVLSVANLYELKFITQFTLTQMFGIICVFDLLRFVYKPSKDETWEELLEKAFSSQLTLLFTYLFSWGLTFVVYYWFLS